MEDTKKVPREDIATSTNTEVEESFGKIVFSGVEPPTTRNVEDLFENQFANQIVN